MRMPSIAALAIVLCAAGAALAAGPSPPRDTPPAPLVLLLPDATGDEGRADAYVEALAARGIASLVLGMEELGEGPRASLAPAPHSATLDLVRDWMAGDAPLPGGGRVAVIGFGAGARVALTFAGVPVVALDPGCRGLVLSSRPHDVLLVHGLAAPDAADCAALARGAGLARLPLPGIGHGWDLPVVAAPGGALLPDPSGPGRRRARPDPIATAAVAEAVADWIAPRLRAVRP